MAHAGAFVPLDCQALSALEIQQAIGRLFAPSQSEEFFDSPAALRPGTILLLHAERLPRDYQKTVVDGLRGLPAEKVELRLIASTTLDPLVLETDERLRPDFYHLLTHLCIAVPPLSRPMEDLQPLAQHLLEESNRGEARQFNGFAEDVWVKFAEYNWPGNVDELQAVIREARSTCNEPLIRAKDLPFASARGMMPSRSARSFDRKSLHSSPSWRERKRGRLSRRSKSAAIIRAKRPSCWDFPGAAPPRRMEMLGIADQPESA